MTISQILLPFTLQTIFRYNYKSNDVFYFPNLLYKVYLTALKTVEIEMDGLGNILYYCTPLHIICLTFTWIVHFELPFRLKGTDKIHTKGLFKFPSMYILCSVVLLFSSLRQECGNEGRYRAGFLSSTGRVLVLCF